MQTYFTVSEPHWDGKDLVRSASFHSQIISHVSGLLKQHLLAAPVATRKDSKATVHAPSLTGVFQEHIIYSLCAPKLHWNSDEFQWHTAREAMRYQSCNHVNGQSVHSANGAKSLEWVVLKIPRADSFTQQASLCIGMLLTPG